MQPPAGHMIEAQRMGKYEKTSQSNMQPWADCIRNRKVQAAKPSDHAASGGAHELSSTNAKVQAIKLSERAAEGGVREPSKRNRQVRAAKPSDQAAWGRVHDLKHIEGESTSRQAKRACSHGRRARAKLLKAHGIKEYSQAKRPCGRRRCA